MTTLRILTLNIGSLFEPKWDERETEIVAWLDHLDPDVVCLQEVHKNGDAKSTGHSVAARAARDWHVSFGGYPIDHPDAGPELLFGSAILSRWPIDTSTSHRLAIAEDQNDPMPAMIPWELVYASTAGLDVWSTHLAPAPTHGIHRRAQVREIDDVIRESRGDLDAIAELGMRREAMPPILCGDFNAEPDSDEIRFLCGLTPLAGRTTFYQDAWRVAGADEPGYTQDWRVHPLAGRLNVHRKRIDYIFVGDPFVRVGDVGRVLDARVVCDTPRTGIHASDHSGLLAEIVWPARPAQT